MTMHVIFVGFGQNLRVFGVVQPRTVQLMYVANVSFVASVMTIPIVQHVEITNLIAAMRYDATGPTTEFSIPNAIGCWPTLR